MEERDQPSMYIVLYVCADHLLYGYVSVYTAPCPRQPYTTLYVRNERFPLGGRGLSLHFKADKHAQRSRANRGVRRALSAL